MRVLMSGASGFIGRHLSRALIDGGDEVVVVCRPGRVQATQSILGRSIPVVVDSGSAATLTEDLAIQSIDATVNLAGRLDPQPDLDDLDSIVEANIGFPTRLAAATAAAAPNSVFVSVGTVWEHLDSRQSGARSVYAATKRAFGEVLAFYGGDGGLEVRTIVLPWVYGPGQPPSAIVSLLVNALVTGERLEATSGDGVLDLVHIDDVVGGFLTVLDPELGSGRWMLSSGRGLRVREIAEEMEKLARRPVPVQWGALPNRSSEIADLIRAAPLLPSWSPAIPLEDGLSALLADLDLSGL